MAEEKPKEHESHEHEVKESKTITLKKSTLLGIGVFALVALLVVSIFTGGFGIMKPTGNVANTGNTGTANAVQQMISQSGDLVGMAGKIEQLAQQGQIQFIYVPLSFLGQGSVYSAEAAFCANDQGKFWQMHDAIFTNQVPPDKEGAQFTKAQLETIAKGISGLDTSKFNSCLENDADLSKVQQVTAETQKAGVQIATPQFFVNGQSIQPSWAAVQSAINANSNNTTTIDTSIFADSSLFPSLGTGNGKATVIEFADFQCPWCGLAAGMASWVTA